MTTPKGWVRIKHPITGGEATVAPTALPHHLAAGWEIDPDPEPEPVRAVAPPRARTTARPKDEAGTRPDNKE